MAQQTKIHATGKRKTSVARVFLTPGNGRIAVNGREFEEYFPVLALRAIAVQPLVLTGKRQSVDVEVNVRGGGPASQADSVKYGIARALQVEVRWREEPDSLVVYLVTDSLGIALPADLYNPFAGDSGRPVFEVGREYTLGVAVTDTNYYDYVRSRSDPFTGRGFLNRLDGGIGVFGSVETYRYYLRVVR